jgi:hypothetical protein
VFLKKRLQAAENKGARVQKESKEKKRVRKLLKTHKSHAPEKAQHKAPSSEYRGHTGK